MKPTLKIQTRSHGCEFLFSTSRSPHRLKFVHIGSWACNTSSPFVKLSIKPNIEEKASKVQLSLFSFQFTHELGPCVWFRLYFLFCNKYFNSLMQYKCIAQFFFSFLTKHLYTRYKPTIRLKKPRQEDRRWLLVQINSRRLPKWLRNEWLNKSIKYLSVINNIQYV